MPPPDAVPKSANLPHLSPRQTACLQLVAAGHSSPEIARTLGISSRTVNQHITDACLRLHVRRRVQAVAFGVKLGLISNVLWDGDI
jgi:DNA-binding CsgD family transcriptional regulator